MPGHWQRIWGEPYVGAWHREVKGYHFFGRHFRTEEIKTAELVKEIDAKCGLAKSGRPFFHFSHIRAHANLNRALRPYPNAVGFFGHWHASAANWNQIHMLSSGPTLQCPSCAPMGNNSLGAKKFDWTKVDIEGAEAAGKNRQGYVVRVYDDMVVFQRREFGRGGSLGTDWVMPIVSEDSGKCEGWKHPFSKDELKKKIGEPQFRDGAKLEVAFSAAGTQSGGEQKGTTSTESASLHIKIPLADGNKDSRVFLYNVEIRGDADVLHKSVYASGVNMGIGHEPNKGVTTLVVPQSELPRGETLAMTATPFSSLGTHGKSISDQIVRKLV